MEYHWLGMQDYQKVYDQQRLSLTWSMEREEVWGLEHPEVISLGRRSTAQEDFSSALQLPCVATDRGGLTTLHSPGQLIIYPLISLERRQWRPREYVCHLLKITQNCLNEIGLKTQIDSDSSGLFVQEKKICFIGLRVSSGRVYHGLSLNVSNNLNLFDQISACGWRGRPLTSLAEEGHNSVNPEDVFKLWYQVSKERFLFENITSLNNP